MSSPKEYHFDAVYPEPLSRLRRGHGHTHAMGGLVPSSEAGTPTAASYRRAVKKQRMNRSSAGRFRTQPVTFQEIKEVDEENVPELEPDLTTTLGKSVVAGGASRSESDLKARFELFYKSINDPTSEGTVRSPPIAISFPVCPVHSTSSPLCQATCFLQQQKTTTADDGNNGVSTTSSTNNPETGAPAPSSTSTTTPTVTTANSLMTNIAAMGARSRQSF